jgi:hypothetical protein
MSRFRSRPFSGSILKEGPSVHLAVHDFLAAHARKGDSSRYVYELQDQPPPGGRVRGALGLVSRSRLRRSPRTSSLIRKEVLRGLELEAASARLLTNTPQRSLIMQLRYAAIAALLVGLGFVSSQVLAATTAPTPAPTAGAASCINGFTTTATTWNKKSAPSFTCLSSKPTCPSGMTLKHDNSTKTALSYKCSATLTGVSASDDWESHGL